MKRLLIAALFVFLTAVAQPFATAALPYTNGDLFLGVRASSGTGANQDYLINIGQASNFTNATGPVSVVNIGADLTAIFGPNWNTRSNVFWSVSGANLPADTLNTLYATKAESPAGTVASPWLGNSSSSQGSTKTRFNQLAGAYQIGTANATTPLGLIQSTVDTNSYASFQPGGTFENSGNISFAAFNPTIEANFANGAGGTILDLFKIAPVFEQPGVRVGSFQVDANGAVTFIPASFATFRFVNSSFTVSEGVSGGSYSLAVQRGGDLSGAVSVVLNTTDGSAVAPTDYAAQSNVTVPFAANQTSATVPINIVNRATYQGDRTFNVTLSNPSAGATIAAYSSATVTIQELDPPPPGVIAFSSAQYDVSSVNSLGNPNNVVVTLSRTNGSAVAVSVDVSVTGGTLVNGIDYQTFTNPTTVNFAVGETSKEVAIALNTIASGSLPGTIALGLSNATNGATLGATQTTTVNVYYAGSLAFSTSAYTTGENSSADSTVEITVVRTGGTGVVSVEVAAAGGTATEGTDFTLPASPVVLNWASGETGPKSFNITVKSDSVAEAAGETILLALQNVTGGALLTGQSATVTILDPDTTAPTLTVTAPKAAGKFTSANVTFSGTATDTQGVGRIEIVLNGGAPEVLTPANPSTSFNWTTNLVPKQGANTAVITAFDLQGTPSTSISRSFTFANLRPQLAGKYNGLLVATAASNKPFDHNGLLALTITSTGGFSGKLTVSGVSLPVSGVFEADGSARFKPANGTTFELIKKAAGTTSSLGHLSLTVDTNATDKVSGVLKDGTGQGAIALGQIDHADRALYVAKKNPVAPLLSVPTILLDPTREKGKYTVVFQAAPAPNNGIAASDFPQGDGYGLLSISPAGVAKIVGKLADGSPVSYSNALSKDNKWPLFVQLYKKKGFIGGEVAFDPQNSTSDASGLNLKWFKPAALAGEKLYPNGWPSVITADFFASKYLKPGKATASIPTPPNPDTVLGPGVPGEVNTATANITITLAEGGLSASVSADANLNAASKITPLSPNAASVKATLAVGNGSLNGSFKHPVNGKTVTFSGVAFQKTNTASGYFIYTSAPGTPGLSGAVGITKK